MDDVPDEIGNLDEMEITTRLNGEVMQNAKAACSFMVLRSSLSIVHRLSI